MLATFMIGQIILHAPVAPPSSCLWAGVSSPVKMEGMRQVSSATHTTIAHTPFRSVGRFLSKRNLKRIKVETDCQEYIGDKVEKLKSIVNS